MNSKFKRLLACLLSLTLMVSMLSTGAITAFAEETSTVSESGTWGGIDWTLSDDGTLTIAPTKGEPVPDKNAPTKRTYEVGEWREAVRYDSEGVGKAVEGWPYKSNIIKIKSLVIEEGVTSIGSFAFNAKYSLDLSEVEGEVVIPSTVTYIGQEAFQGVPMSKLTFAKVPEGQEAKELRVAHGAFKDLIIEEVALPDDRPVTLHCWAFLMCTNLKSITIPATIRDMHGCDEIDYESSMSVSANPQWTTLSQIVGGYNNKGVASNPNMETIIFGSQAARDKFYSYADNKLGNTGAVATVVSGAATFAGDDVIIDCASLELAAEIAEPGDTITLLKNTDEVVEIPAGVTLDNNGFTADNVTEKNYVAQIGEQGYATLAEAIADANAGDTITFLADITEDVTISKAITIDGAEFNYTGKMTVAGAVGSVNFINVKFMADTTVGNNVIVDLQRYAEATFDGCDFTSNSTDTYYNSYKGIAIANDCSVEIKNSTASKLYYMAHISQGSKSLVVEDCELTDMVYGIGAFKCENVVVKDFNYSGMASGINVKNSIASTLALENVNITTTMSGQASVAMWKPDSGNTAVKYTITLKDKNIANGAAMTKDNEANWFARQDESNPYEIKDLNLAGSGTEADPYQIGSVEDLIMFRDSVNAGETKYNAPGVYVALTDDIDMAGATWERGIGDGINATFDGIFDGKNFTIKNLNLAPKADSDNYFCGGLFGYTYGAAVIKNVVLENITVTAEGEGHNVGALVGFAYNKGGKLNVSNVTVTNVTIYAPDVYGVGSIVGYSYYAMGTIENCSVDDADITGYSFVGGITGYSYSDAVITGCSVENATITATSKGAGGIAGLALGGNKITGNTVANTTVTASKNWGYVVGELGASNANISNNTAAQPHIGGDYANGEAYQAKIGDKYYTSIADAIAAAKDGDTITLLADITLSEGITNTKKITLDLNGKTITGTDNATASFGLITNKGELTITGNGKVTVTATNNRGWNAYSSVISNTVGGKLTVEGGTIEHLGGTDMAYAIDNLTNGKGTYAETVIKGGTIKSTYRAIRQFLNGVEAQNILTINGGIVEGANKSVWMQDPSKNANTGKITVAEGATLIGDVYLTVTEGSTEWPVEVSIAASAVNGEVLASNVPEDYVLENTNGTYGIIKKATLTIGSVEDLIAFGAAVTGNTAYQDVKVAANPEVIVKLTADLDLANSGFTPIGNGAANAFSGIFDGQGHTISNMTLSCDYYRGVGFFRSLGKGAVIKNVTFVNANVNNGAGTGANHFYGVVAGFSENLTLENVDVKDSTVTCKYSGAAMVGCLQGATVIKNADIENVTLNTTDIRAAVYGIIGNSASGHTIAIENNTIKNVKLSINGEIKTLPETVVYGSWNAGKDYAESTYVAQIGDKKYSTLFDAIKVAKDGDIISLLADITTSKTFTVADGKKITLDMNGKKITVNDSATKNYELFYIYGEMVVTGNGTIELTSTNNRAWNAMSAIFHNRGGVLTIENGTYTNNGGTDMAFVVDNSGNYYGDVVTNIKGGTLTSSYIAIRNRMEQNTHGASGKAILNVSGGTIDGTSRAIWAQAASTSTVAPATGEINISGGKIGLIDTARSNGAVSVTTITGGTVASFKGESGELKVNGGKITGTVTIMFANGDAATKTVKKNYVYYAATARIGQTYYASLADAVASTGTKSANTIIYLTHDAEGVGFEVKSAVQLMFQGFTYTITEPVEGTNVGIKVSNRKLAMRDGSLKVAEGADISTMIEAYADLSAAGMKMDGTYLVGETPVVISAKSGDIILTEAATKLTVADNGWAIDVSSAEGYARPAVNVHTLVKNSGGVKTKQINAIVNYSTKYYGDLQQALDAHSSVYLLADCDANGIKIAKNVTIYKNGHKLTNSSKIAKENGAKVTIK